VDFYTNVAKYGQQMLVCGYRDGERYKQRVKYEPFLFVKSQKGTYQNIFGDCCARKDFSSIREAQQFIDKYEGVEGFRWYGMTNWVYPFINDTYLGEFVDYDFSQIKVHIIDIETGRNAAGEYAKVENADGPVTMIGVRIGEQRLVFAYKDLEGAPLPANTTYVWCSDEADMLERWVRLMENEDHRPDVLTGWNIEQYDVPYLVNRINKILGDDQANRISPWGMLREKEQEGYYGKTYTTYTPVGVNIIDYLPLYKKFTFTKQLESFSLDHVAMVEVGRGKVDYKSQGYRDLEDLYERNYPLFVQYNVEDLDRVADIDAKNKMLELAFTVAYQAKVNPIDALTTVKLWEVIVHNHLLAKGIVFDSDCRGESEQVPGGYNFEPTPGFYKWVMSFDLQSLYPHLMMWMNISPETLIQDGPLWPMDRSPPSYGRYCAAHPGIIGGQFDQTTDYKTSQYARAGNGALFRKDIKGFFYELMDRFFGLRKQYKDKMIEAKKAKGSAAEIARWHNHQLGVKVMINGFYGATGNRAFAYYDSVLASAVTLSGQLAIRWIAARMNEVMNKSLGTNGKNYVIAGDTDSLYLDFSAFVARFVPDKPVQSQVDFLDRLAKQFVQPEIQKAFEELGRRMNAYDPGKLIMKRDVISDAAIWRAKKGYAMRVWDEEGVRYEKPKLKITGLEVIKAGMPHECKAVIKDVIALILDQQREEAEKKVSEFRKMFMKLKVEEIAKPISANDIYKYADKDTIWKRDANTPYQVKGALSFNYQISKPKYAGKFLPIRNGDKVKTLYLMSPNPTDCNVISFVGELPPELDLHKFADYEKMYETQFFEPVKTLMDLVGWETKAKQHSLASLMG
jgi:Kyanoviridae DNA polymerase